ncbi:MAG: DUF1330 domain-containing protein [Cytophagales bacterium]|nr:DUF1330 domain-containing protein [Cytophagales bacterium]
MKRLSNSVLKGVFVLLCGIVIAGVALARVSEEKVNDKYYQVVMIWLKDPAKFQEYGQKMGPIVGKYGGSGERILTPVESFYGGKTGEGLSKPDMVNIVYYYSKEAYENFENDPAFKKIEHLRSESINMVAIGGKVKGGELLPGDASQRLYMIEFGYFKDKGKNYKAYEKASKGFNQRLGLNKERILIPDQVWGDIALPDLVTIKYIDDASNKSKMESDPDHAKIEALYGEAMSDLIWIEGKAAFINMN